MLTAAALLPAIVLMVYIYKKDQVEKEPLWLLGKIFLFGMISTVPTIVTELVLERALGRICASDSPMFIVLEAFVVVALTEEFWKRWAVRRAAWKSREFNYRFDAYVYCAFSALGFAALENILYVFENGMRTAVVRAFTAVPSHAIDGVIMGAFLGEAKLWERRGNERRKKRYMRLALIMPAVCHGVYDYSLMAGSALMSLVFIVFVVSVDIWAIRHIRWEARQDHRI